MGLLLFNFVYHLAFHVSAFHVCCPVRVTYLTQSHRMEHVLFVVTTAVGSMPPTGNCQYAQFSTEDFLMCSLRTTSMFTVVICLIKHGDQRHGGRSGCVAWLDWVNQCLWHLRIERLSGSLQDRPPLSRTQFTLLSYCLLIVCRSMKEHAWTFLFRTGSWGRIMLDAVRWFAE